MMDAWRLEIAAIYLPASIIYKIAAVEQVLVLQLTSEFVKIYLWSTEAVLLLRDNMYHHLNVDVLLEPTVLQ